MWREYKEKKKSKKFLSWCFHKTFTYASALEILETKTSWGFSGNFWDSSRIKLWKASERQFDNIPKILNLPGRNFSLF